MAEPVAVVDQLTGCLRRVLAELDEADADIIRQCDLNGQRQQDYAAAHGLSLPATKARLRRAQSLHRRFDQCRILDRRRTKAASRGQGHRQVPAMPGRQKQRATLDIRPGIEREGRARRDERHASGNQKLAVAGKFDL